MTFAETLARLRREKGLSQEQLADWMDVSRQAVSKWEAGQSMPDLPRLIALADLFGVSLDALVRPERADDAQRLPDSPAFARQANDAQPPAPGAVRAEAQGKTLWIPAGSTVTVVPGYEYKSKRTLFGLPLVHVSLGYGLRCAKGVFAVGNCAVGVVAAGGFSLGVLGFGGIAAGLLGVGGLAFGALCLGGVAVGGVAIGACAIGVYALGAAAVASKAAVGVSALAPVSAAVGKGAQFLITEETSLRDVAEYLRAAGVPRPLVWLLSLGGK